MVKGWEVVLYGRVRLSPFVGGGDDYGSMGAIRGTLALFIYIQAEVFDNLFSDFEFCGF